MAILGNPTKYQDFPTFTAVGTGSQSSWTLPWTPGSVNNLDVFVGGSIQAGTFTIVGNVINFSTAPSLNEKILIKSKGIRSVFNKIFRRDRVNITPTNGQTVFPTAPYSYVPGSNDLSFFVNGSKWILTQDYTEPNGTSVSTVVSGYTFSTTDSVEIEIVSVS